MMEEKLTAHDIVECNQREIPSVPLVGIKYFEPHRSNDELLEVCNHLTASKSLISHKKVQKQGSLSLAKWHPELEKAEVTKHHGPYWSTMGHVMDNKLYLFPEEALYLLEIGVLELTYNDVPMSVQRGYVMLLEPLTRVSLECFRVYSQLTASGYRVLHHTLSNSFTRYEKELKIHKAGIKRELNESTAIKNKRTEDNVMEVTAAKKLKIEDLTKIFPVCPTDKNENDIIEELRIFKPYESTLTSKLQVNYDVYQNNGKSTFKKTCLQLPSVRVIVHRGSDPLPDLEDFYQLAKQFEDEVPLVHAIVFPECITFYSIMPTSTPVCDE